MSSKGKLAARRTFTAEFKANLVIQLLTKERTVAELSREHDIREGQLHNWRQEFLERSAKAFAPDEPVGERRKVADLERLAGKQAMEIAILKRALDR